MQIYPIGSSVSFGHKDKNQTLSIPTAIASCIGSAIFANSTKIKLDKNSYLNTIDIIDKKMDKNLEILERFNYLKKLTKPYTDKLASLGIIDNSAEITVENMLKNYVKSTEKDYLKELEKDINFAKAETLFLENENLSAKNIEIKEKEFIKSLAENATDGKIKTAEIKNYFEPLMKEDSIIKAEITDFSRMVDKFNKKRIGVFGAFGLIIGAIIGNFINIKKKD